MKEIVILGGPNGAGKTTAAKALLPSRLGIREFVNADEIAHGMSPFNDERMAIAAARLMLLRIDELVREGESFGFETTCSGRGHARLLNRAKANGWRILLIFLWLPSPEQALERVKRRVSMGGHSIPADVVIRRYWGSLRNLHGLYLPLADIAAIYDNSDKGPVMIAERTPESKIAIRDASRWAAMQGVR